MNTKRSRSGHFVSYMIIYKWIQKVSEVETKDTHSEMVFYGTRKMKGGTAMYIWRPTPASQSAPDEHTDKQTEPYNSCLKDKASLLNTCEKTNMPEAIKIKVSITCNTMSSNQSKFQGTYCCCLQWLDQGGNPSEVGTILWEILNPHLVLIA